MKMAEPIRPSLDSQRFDVAVIGGGINGVAIARECARAGKRTLLLEQNDFSSGTTSRSTRIIHGGLRYLEHGELGLVAESLRERRRLLRTRPHLVRPRQFLLALPQDGDRSALAIRAALWAYRLLGGSHSSPAGDGTLRELSQYLDAGRGFFVIPWNGQLLVGTTEVQDDGDPAAVHPSPTELDYLLRSFKSLFPRHPVTPGDVRYAFAGIRPLPFSPGREYAAITRRALIHDHTEEGAAGLISVIGGKLTTAASLARQCLRALGISAKREPLAQIALAPADGLESSFRQWARQISGWAGIAESSARAIAEWHGRRAMCVARLAASSESLRAPLCGHSLHLVAEAGVAAQYESAVHLGDILW